MPEPDSTTSPASMASGVADAERLLRPGLGELLAAWREVVVAERLQVEELPNRPRPEDFYGPVAETFRADPDRSDDPVLNHLRTLARPNETWLDLGAGGGRYALALARRVARLIAVEPSAGMRDVLTSAAAEHGIGNVEVFAERWPGRSSAPVADVGFMSHVSYDIEDIGPFLDQLEAHASQRCVAVLYETAPTADFAPLWQAVHGQRRLRLPAMREFVSLLFARGSAPELTFFATPPRVFADAEALHRAARRPLWVLEGSAEDMRLAAAVRDGATAVDGGVRLGSAARRVGVVTWQAASK